jgi:CubicO group peptidase (beta-lactamase class C family)
LAEFEVSLCFRDASRLQFIQNFNGSISVAEKGRNHLSKIVRRESSFGEEEFKISVMKTFKRFFTGGVLLAVSFCVNVAAQFKTIKTNSEIAAWAEDYMNNAVKFDHFSGAVLIARDGKPIFSRAFGMANYELDVPNNLNTKFRIGSVSKQFTAAAILQLQERGKLNVGDPICKYLDDCPTAWQPITIRNLLNHTSGIVNFTRLPEASGKFLLVPHSHKEIVDVFRHLPLESAPGEKYHYNNSGYYLLGLIVEKASGEKYWDYLRKNIFAPLGMNDTDSDDGETIVKNRASAYYLGTDSIFRNTYYTNMEILFSIGGAYSTVKDLLIWERSLAQNKLLKSETVTEMFTPGKGDYGYGWWIDKLGECRRMYHDGGITNFSTSLQVLPDERLTIIAVSNRGDDGGIRAAYDIAGKICGVPATIRGIQPELTSLNAEKSLAVINDAKAKFPIFDVRENKVEELGNYLMLVKEKKQAVEVFKVNVGLYPKSVNARLKLAAAYEQTGEKTLAAQTFKQVLELDPANKIALEHLKKLGN